MFNAAVCMGELFVLWAASNCGKLLIPGERKHWRKLHLFSGMCKEAWALQGRLVAKIQSRNHTGSLPTDQLCEVVSVYVCPLCLCYAMRPYASNPQESQEEISARIYQNLLSFKAQINISGNGSPPSECLFNGGSWDLGYINNGRKGYDSEQVHKGSLGLSRTLSIGYDSLNVFIMEQDLFGKHRRLKIINELAFSLWREMFLLICALYGFPQLLQPGSFASVVVAQWWQSDHAGMLWCCPLPRTTFPLFSVTLLCGLGMMMSLPAEFPPQQRVCGDEACVCLCVWLSESEREGLWRAVRPDAFAQGSGSCWTEPQKERCCFPLV